MIRRGTGLPRAEELLEGVSRTFALTIPQLPGGLREAVANAYLLCRIADTIEDDPGLADVNEFESYCYYVAGVVGEMLTELFCDHSSGIEARRDDLEARSVSFGLGLQMTNILKDVWDDHENGVCWLPREVFAGNGYDLDELQPNHNGNGSAFSASMQTLVGVAHAHLRRALEYTLLIPRIETGIRRFLIWAALLAVSTLRKIAAKPLFTSGAEVKVSRRRVTAIVASSGTVIRSNLGLSTLFRTAARGLPLRGEPGNPVIDGERSR
jgi:farnesyl-diphosphate farnesyltransferase